MVPHSHHVSCLLPCLPCTLQWVRSLHPDVFVVCESDYAAGGTFLIPRVWECFDLIQRFTDSHDMICARWRDRESASLSYREVQPSMRANASVHADEDVAGRGAEERTAFSALRLGVPESCLQMHSTGLHEGPPTFNHPLEHEQVSLFEAMSVQRPVFNIVSVEGDQRFIRPLSQKEWVKLLLKHGFVASPNLSLVEQEMYAITRGYPDFFGVESTEHGLALNVCGGVSLFVNLWTT